MHSVRSYNFEYTCYIIFIITDFINIKQYNSNVLVYNTFAINYYVVAARKSIHYFSLCGPRLLKSLLILSA